jgi:hypothetical protein
MLQNYVLRVPSVKKILKIPEPIAKSSADIIAKRNQDNALTNVIGKFFPQAMKDIKTDTSGIKLMTQQEMHKKRGK